MAQNPVKADTSPVSDPEAFAFVQSLASELSTGKVASGEIECPYHGWRYNGEGRCTAVPGHVGDVVMMDEAVGTRRLTLTCIVTAIAATAGPTSAKNPIPA